MDRVSLPCGHHWLYDVTTWAQEHFRKLLSVNTVCYLNSLPSVLGIGPERGFKTNLGWGAFTSSLFAFTWGRSAADDNKAEALSQWQCCLLSNQKTLQNLAYTQAKNQIKEHVWWHIVSDGKRGSQQSTKSLSVIDYYFNGTFWSKLMRTYH